MMWGWIHFQSMRIKDNEECPCGSGKKYVGCCKGKQAKLRTSPKPPEVQIMEKMRSSMKRCCMHPDKDKCKGKIKGAHALQNNKIISLLAGTERHVYMMDAKKQPLLIPLENGETIPFVEMSRISANDATTETCFCDYHDNVAFSVIEKAAPDFDRNRSEMKFVYAYKAFIFEYYKQWIGFDIYRKCFADNPAAFVQPEMVGMYRMLEIKMAEFEPIKNHFDSQIMAGIYDGICTCTVKIPEQINFADYAFIAPDYDMNGKKIKHTVKGVMHRLAITVFPETNQSWVLMSCLESERNIYEKFFAQIETAPLEKLKYYLNMILPLYSENMVLSGRLWNSWSEEIQMAYTYYANLQGKDAMVMGKGIGFGLLNASRDKTGKAYENPPKINLFANIEQK